MIDPGSRGDYADRVVVVSGGAGQLGRCFVAALVRQGAIVHVIDRDAAALEGLAAAHHDNVVCHLAELAEQADIDRVVEAISSAVEHVDALIHSVGGNDFVESFADITADSWRRVLDMNLVGPALLTRGLQPLLAARPPAGVVFITSINAHMSSRWPHYAAAKAGAAKLVGDLSVQWAPLGIRVNAVAPGLLIDYSEPDERRHRPHIRLTSSAVPFEAIVEAALFLADPQRSPCTTGQQLSVEASSPTT